jgi:ubiquinone/menaquinone biosynthesis C-methylase UbiE
MTIKIIMAWRRGRVDCLPAILGLGVLAALMLWSPRRAFAWGTDDAALAEEIATLLAVKPGSTVAEVGAGHGQMAIRMAQRVGPSGHVYASEIDPLRIAEIQQRVRDAGLGNLTAVTATPTDSGLPPACCEAVYMIGVYHHLTNPTATDASIFRALRSGGRLLIDDFPPTLWLALFKVAGVPANRGGHGVPDQIVANELTGVGFNLVREIRPWHAGFFIRDNYCLLFAKPVDPAATQG